MQGGGLKKIGKHLNPELFQNTSLLPTALHGRRSRMAVLDAG